MLSAVCLFVVVFAGLTAWGRSFFSASDPGSRLGALHFATSPRYAAPALVFWVAAAGLVVRLLVSWEWPGPSARAR